MSVRKPKELKEINTRREHEYSTNSTTSQALVNLIEKIICSIYLYMSINLIHNLRKGYYSKYQLQNACDQRVFLESSFIGCDDCMS